MAVKTLTINGQQVTAQDNETILSAARSAGIPIPTLCHLDGLTPVGACRMCLIEVEGSPRLFPACVATVSEGMVVTTNSERLVEYRKMILELLFAERNHHCAVCVANGNCELQNMAVAVGMDHVRYDYISPDLKVDCTHARFGIDHNRCILCTRCVRTCDEVEGAHTWDVAGRGASSIVITDLYQKWGESETCTSCGKCLHACPTGAIFNQHSTVAEMKREPQKIFALVSARGKAR